VRNILIDNRNWERYKSFHNDLRPEQIKEVDSMLICNNPIKGYFWYYCDVCKRDIIRHLSCNSRICPRCGTKYVNAWATKTTNRMLNVDHNHIIFTMPDCLWPLIKNNYNCIKELAEGTFKVISESMNQSAKQFIIPGMINTLHTYGEDMKWNVHFHTIVTQGGMNKNNKWKSITFIPYEILRVKWKIYCLKIIKKNIPMNSNNQTLFESLYYHEYRNGFNIRVVKSGIPKKELIGYIARYIRHPAISNRRIIGYDKNVVTISCDKKKDKSYTLSFTVEEFITRLIQHIPEKNFKLTRSYGLYSRRKTKIKLKYFVQESILFYTKSQHSIECPYCGKILHVIEYFPPSFASGPPLAIRNLTEWIS